MQVHASRGRFGRPILCFSFCLLAAANSTFGQQACGAGTNTYTFTNYCAFPVWMANLTGSSTQSFPPQGNASNWQLAAVGAACTTSATCTGGAVCQSGICVSQQTFCMPQSWSAGRFWPRTGCIVPNGCTGNNCLTCDTGDCKGNLDCGLAGTSGLPPATLFEATTNTSGANYDVSIASGYNVPISVTPVGGSCQTAGCVADLNATCPASLQFTGKNGGLGCMDPCDQCANGSTQLSCSTAITGLSNFSSCGGTSLPVTFQNMYCAKNAAANSDGFPLASSNQGTPTCYRNTDCPPTASTCQTTGFTAPFSPPAGMGVCINPTGNLNLNGCNSSNVGQACGGMAIGYPSANGYTCQSVSVGQSTAFVCVPPTTSGMGACTQPWPASNTINVTAGANMHSVTRILTTPTRPRRGQRFNFTITGSNFSRGSSVAFEGPNCPSCAASAIRVTPTRITGAAILGAGTFNATVRSAAGVHSNAVHVAVGTTTPAITGITTVPTLPQQGQQFSFTLAGSNFTPTTAVVLFNGPLCWPCQVTPVAATSTSTSLNGLANLIYGTYSITVQNGDGPVSNAVSLAVNAQGLPSLPTLSSVTLTGTASPFNLSIQGSSFTTTTATVVLNGPQCSPCTIPPNSLTITATSITGTVTLSPGTFSVSVQNGGPPIPLYSGVGGVFNPAWIAAGVQAGTGTLPYFQIFSNACPQAYTWQYDDQASDFACTGVTGFNVTLCPNQAPTGVKK
jgi:Thaumatin family/EB module